MGLADLTFRAIGADVMREYWPVFVAGALFEVWLVRRIRRSGRFPVLWIVSTLLLVACLSAALWAESFLAGQLVAQTVGDNGIGAWEELGWHVSRSWPPVSLMAVMLVVLAARPRSDVVIAVLVCVAGTLASWTVAMWLFTTTHQEAVFRLLVLPGGLGVLASILGFTAATGIWIAIGRWIWGEGRRRRRRRRPPGRDAAMADDDVAGTFDKQP